MQTFPGTYESYWLFNHLNIISLRLNFCMYFSHAQRLQNVMPLRKKIITGNTITYMASGRFLFCEYFGLRLTFLSMHFHGPALRAQSDVKLMGITDPVTGNRTQSFYITVSV
jgi:hypothetical protein